MSPRALLALAVLLALATPVAPLPTDASGVVELNDLNFDSYVDGRSTWLIAVLAPGADPFSVGADGGGAAVPSRGGCSSPSPSRALAAPPTPAPAAPAASPTRPLAPRAGCGACAKLHLPLEDAARELFPHVRVGKVRTPRRGAWGRRGFGCGLCGLGVRSADLPGPPSGRTRILAPSPT